MARGRKAAAATPQVDGNVTREAFLSAYDVVTEKLRLKKEADSALANAYRAAERAGVDRKMLKAVRAEADLSAEERAINDRRRRLYLQWLNKPIGTQAEMPLPDAAGEANGHAEPPDEADQAHARTEAYEWGVSAGKGGAADSSCPYQPGSSEMQEWKSGWIEGQRVAVESLGGASA